MITFLQVTTPLLKFMAEFVLNKAQRLTFDSSSANGILLFREVSKLVVAYGSRILSLPNTPEIYSFKYKGIWICLTILARGESICANLHAGVIFVIFLHVLRDECVVCDHRSFKLRPYPPDTTCNLSC